MNILAIGAHPDDIEFGCGGTLIKYRRLGHKVYLLVTTHGDQGGDGNVRAKELRRSAQIMGAADLFIFDYHDTRLPLDKELITRIEDIIKVVGPNIIFVHHFDAPIKTTAPFLRPPPPPLDTSRTSYSTRSPLHKTSPPPCSPI